MKLHGISKQGLNRIAKSVESKSKKATTDPKIWEMADRLREVLGDDEFIEALLRAMSIEEAEANLKFMWQTYDMNSLEGEDEEY